MDASQFLSALLAIIVIDVVLAGDNAIVIALAARNLPAHLQKRAIVWGAVGAIAVRSAMTVIVVWLLKIPGLLLAGGLLLLWIAYRLLLPEDDAGDKHGKGATTFWGAMRTIVIADAVMGLDNVLAVAGAAHGSYLLVVTGLVVSVPIVVWGSTLVLKVVDRFPAVMYLGAGVLAWTAIKMMSGEPLVKPYLASWPMAAHLAYLVIPLVLGLGYLANHRRVKGRIRARLAEHADRRPTTAASIPTVPTPPAGERPMLSVLVPVDGSSNAMRAVHHAINEYRRDHSLLVHLLNVQPRLSRHIARFVPRSDRQAWQQAQADTALAAPRAALEAAGVPHQVHRADGDRAGAICRLARELKADHIVMGTARKHSLTRMLEDSTTLRVLESATVPVEVIAGDNVSSVERWGWPVGLAGLGGLLWLTAD